MHLVGLYTYCGMMHGAYSVKLIITFPSLFLQCLGLGNALAMFNQMDLPQRVIYFQSNCCSSRGRHVFIPVLKLKVQNSKLSADVRTQCDKSIFAASRSWGDL